MTGRKWFELVLITLALPIIAIGLLVTGILIGVDIDKNTVAAIILLNLFPMSVGYIYCLYKITTVPFHGLEPKVNGKTHGKTG